MLRAFFGIPLDKATIKRLLQDISMLSLALGDNVRWSKPDLWHITVKFLANVHPSDLASLAEAADLFAQVTQTFPLQITKIACFPRPKARIIAAYIAPNPNLHALLGQLDQIGEKMGIKMETRRYRPHITLGKFKSETQYVEPILYPNFQTNINKIVLYQSKPSAEGSHYLPLQQFALCETN